jgi:hypothetical protein
MREKDIGSYAGRGRDKKSKPVRISKPVGQPQGTAEEFPALFIH